MQIMLECNGLFCYVKCILRVKSIKSYFNNQRNPTKPDVISDSLKQWLITGQDLYRTAIFMAVIFYSSSKQDVKMLKMKSYWSTFRLSYYLCVCAHGHVKKSIIKKHAFSFHSVRMWSDYRSPSQKCKAFGREMSKGNPRTNTHTHTHTHTHTD